MTLANRTASRLKDWKGGHIDSFSRCPRPRCVERKAREEGGLGRVPAPQRKEKPAEGVQEHFEGFLGACALVPAEQLGLDSLSPSLPECSASQSF